MGSCLFNCTEYHHLLNRVCLGGLSYSFNVFINYKNAIPFCLSWLGSILLCMCLCGNVCVCMYVHIWRIEADIRLFFCFVFRDRTSQWTWSCLFGLDLLTSKSWWSADLYPPAHVSAWLWGNEKSGSHVCTADTLSSEPSSQTIISAFCRKDQLHIHHILESYLGATSSSP